jgi:hypothetical protein
VMVSRQRVIAIILGLGLVLGTIAYVTAPPPEDNPELYEMLHSKRHVRDLERIAGKSGVLVNDLDEWLSALWEGKTRAITTFAGSLVVAGVYWLATRR